MSKDKKNEASFSVRLKQNYKSGGTSRCQPRMLLKVLIYQYLRNIYSSQKREQGLQENVHFMWLAGIESSNEIRT